MSAPGGGCLLGGVSAPGVSAHGGCLLWEVSALGGVCSWRGCLLGGCLLQGVSAPGGCGIPAGTEAGTPPVNRMTDRCKNITLATTSLRPVNMSI